MKRLFVMTIMICYAFQSLLLNAFSKDEIDNAQIKYTLGSLPLVFIENQGQLAEEVAYYVKGQKKDLYFTSNGMTIALKRKENNRVKRWGIKLEFIDVNQTVYLEAKNKQETIFNYFNGNLKDWKTGIPSYNKLVYHNLWPGIDLIYSEGSSQLKYKFIINPGADPEQIRLIYQGVPTIYLNDKGELVIETPLGTIKDAKPYAFQKTEGKQVVVPISYALDENNKDNTCTFGFDIGDYDKNEPLILDPAILLFCGYVGGYGDEWGGDIAVDNYGNIYLTGTTSADQRRFPVLVGPDLTYNGGDGDVYVAKVNAAGTHFEYCGYIGGSKLESGLGITVDQECNAYIMGYTESKESDGFPVIIGPDLTYNGGEYDVFVAKVNAAGTELVYCGYIGGKENESEYDGDIAVDILGNAYITGHTESDQNSFPVIGGPDLTHNGYKDVFLAKVNKNGSCLDFCGYIGGVRSDFGTAIALDRDANIYIGGWTISEETSFPIRVGPDLTFNGYFDAFVAKINKQGTKLLYCGYIGGIDRDVCADIAVDDERNLYVTGTTFSDEFSFPVINGPDLTQNGGSHGSDAFVAKVNKSGTLLDYCGYIGGDLGEKGEGIAVDRDGNAYVTGDTGSDESSFPVIVGPDLTFNGITDAFITKVNNKGTDLDLCGYIGGHEIEEGRRIAVDNLRNIYIKGFTQSDETNFPVQIGPDLTHGGGFHSYDAFIAKILQRGLSCDRYTISKTGGTVYFNLDAGESNEGRDYILIGALNATNPGSKLPGSKWWVLPFEYDEFTCTILQYLNTPTFVDFFGSLDALGQGTAKLNSYKEIRPEFVGLQMYFAFCVTNPIDFVSNPVPIKIVW